MHKRLGVLLFAYGLFLVCCGALGFILTGETSASSLLNGGSFGSLMMVMGVLHRQGRLWTQPASLSATAVFTLTFTWRAVIQWYTTLNGDTTHVGIAVLLTIMTFASGSLALLLLRHYRH